MQEEDGRVRSTGSGDDEERIHPLRTGEGDDVHRDLRAGESDALVADRERTVVVVGVRIGDARRAAAGEEKDD
jgi:hypothetical protein